MATLKDKMYSLLHQVRNNLNDEILRADKSGDYLDFEKAMDHIKVTEVALKTVRAQIRTMLRKTKPAFQEACPHENKVAVVVRQFAGEKRFVEEESCTRCSKSFKHVDPGFLGTEPIVGNSGR